MAVSVQGNTLESEDVVGWSLEAFEATDVGPLSLPDRLMRALEAGSSAGGDKRCNNDDFQQTALSAFIAVSLADQPPFAAPFSESTELDGPDIPWLYAAVIEEPGGPNPIIELRRQYDSWRRAHLSPCPECDQNPIEVPAGGMAPDRPTKQSGSQEVQTPKPVVKPPEPGPSATSLASTSPQGESSAESGIQSAPWLAVLVLLILVAAAAIIITIIRRSNTTKK